MPCNTRVKKDFSATIQNFLLHLQKNYFFAYFSITKHKSHKCYLLLVKWLVHSHLSHSILSLLHWEVMGIRGKLGIPKLIPWIAWRHVSASLLLAGVEHLTTTLQAMECT